MGRRRGGGGGSGGKPHSNNDRILRRHIEAAGKNYSTVDELVDHLRSSYPHYARHKLRPFTKQVERVFTVYSKNNDTMDDYNDDGDTPIMIKRRKIDDKEEKLQLIEAEHLRRRSGDNSGGCSSSSLASSGSSGGGGSSDEEESTSEDAVYGEKFEPEFDLMKSMMREDLRRKSKKLEKGRAVNNEAVELEVVDNKGTKEVHLMNEESKLGDSVNKNYRKKLDKNDRNNNGGNDGNVINGPMFKDLGGISEVIEELKMEVIVPLYHPQLLHHLGVKPMAGILLHGPPGCGKTKLAHAIANETGVPFYKIGATELVSGVSGASEENIRELFRKAYRTAPSIVFIDEIDAIASKRDNSQREMEKRIVTQLLTSMDESHVPVEPASDDAASANSNCKPGYVLVIGATNRPDAVDPALRRTGRFDREIVLGVPNEVARIEILSVLTQNLRVEGALDLLKIARSTPGFAGADLTALAHKAGNLAMKRIVDKRKDELSKEEKDKVHSEDWLKRPWSDEEMENLYITMADFEEAAKMVQPSSRREGFSAIPNVKWDDVGGLHLLRKEFDRYIVRRIKFPEDYEDFGVDLATGFLLYGPPGCGKTLIAKAVANEAGANFIHIKGPELLNKYVGESELAVRTIFSRARTCSPCILFFDEVDALTTKRGQEGGWVVERLLNQLLIELDGSEQRRGVYVIGATNRPEVMDDAVLRPGRFGKLMYVPLPSPDERGMILKALARKKPIDADVDLMALAKDSRCDNLSGADLSALMNEAAMAALEDKQSSTDRSSSIQWTIKDAHFTSALEKISPSVSDKQIQYYKLLSKSFKAE
ncbi:cell division control protein 48 homolog C [Salvia miltiorrhiza]|uniref:cell division control protein 48 homolog C n=1 Tax=Salvia miltiorrhiza TaxID=226208 RepID=UPI0025AC6787|nr:cell division control protein 48 homolog C [Salvia miltiorrhiza]